jgi:hypothetical protein
MPTTKKTASKKAAPAKKTPAKKAAPAKKTPAKKTPAKKAAPAKKTPAKKATVKKTSAKKAAPAKKATTPSSSATTYSKSSVNAKEAKEAKDYTTIVDLLVLNKDCSTFLTKLAEARMISVLANKGLDHQNRRVVRYTVFVPKKGLEGLKGDALNKALRTHIVKGNFSQDFVKKVCAEKNLDALKMKTMAQFLIEVDCKNYKVKTLKGSSVSMDRKPNLEATNGIVYFIDEPLNVDESK